MKKIEEYINEQDECDCDHQCGEQGWIIEPDSLMTGRNVKNGQPALTKYLRATVVRKSDHQGRNYADTWVVGLDKFDSNDTNGVVVYAVHGALTLDEILFTVLGTINPEEKNVPAAV